MPLFNPQFTYLADSQNNFAWAVFGNVDVDLTDKLELSRRCVTIVTIARTPPRHLRNSYLRRSWVLHSRRCRTHTWDDWQPKVTLRHKPTRDSTLYIGYSRGFRSGGFNQTGVGAAGIAGVNDLFDAETADTYEGGAKAEFLDRRVGANAASSTRRRKDPTSSCSIRTRARRIWGISIASTTRARSSKCGDASSTDSTAMSGSASPTATSRSPGAPRVTSATKRPWYRGHTANVGLQYRHVLRSGLSAFVRSDVEVIGPTWFYPDNFTERDPVTLLNVRLGVDGNLVGDRLGQESHGRNIQRGVVARTDVLPESGLHQQFRFQGTAAPLGRRSELSILSAWALARSAKVADDSLDARTGVDGSDSPRGCPAIPAQFAGFGDCDSAQLNVSSTRRISQGQSFSGSPRP